MSRKRRRTRRTKVLEAMYSKLRRTLGLYPSREELIAALAADDEVTIFSLGDHQRAFRSLLAIWVDGFLNSSIDGVRQFIPVEVNGIRRWVPHGKATAGQLENFRRNIDRPNVDAAERAYRLRGIELEILKQETRFRHDLTAGDIEELVAQANYWLPTTT